MLRIPCHAPSETTHLEGFLASSGSVLPRREARLARRLVGGAEGSPAGQTLIGMSEGLRVTAAWRHVVERLALPEAALSPATPTCAAWNQLFEPWLWLSRQKNETAEGHRTMLDRLQRYALLPWCLGLETPDRQDRVWECALLLQEAVLIWELHLALQGELLDLLVREDFCQRHPSAAIADLFRVDLPTVIFQPAWNDRVGRLGPRHWQAVQARLTEEARAAMWSMVLLEKPSHHQGKLPSPWRLASVDGKPWWELWTELYQQLELAGREEASPSPKAALVESRMGIEAETRTEDVEERGRGGNQPSASTVADFAGKALLPIRSPDDPRLAEALQSQLSACRERGSSMTLAVVDAGGPEERTGPGGANSPAGRDGWQSLFLRHLFEISEGRVGERGFLSEAGELAIIVEGLERSEATTLVREAIQGTCQSWFVDAAAQLPAKPSGTLFAGISSVVIPSKRFRFEQLQQAAWRCLEAARKQGPGAVKSLEVF